MTRYSSLARGRHYIEPRTREYIKVYGFLSFARNLPNNYETNNY